MTGTNTASSAVALSVNSTGVVNVPNLSASLGVYTDASRNLTTTVPTSGQLGYWTRSGTLLWNTNTGDFVGIGTTTPGRTLEVNGDICIPSVSGNKAIYTWANNDANWRIGMSDSPGFSRALATSHVNYLTFASGAGQGFAVGDAVAGVSAFEVGSSGSNYNAYFRGNVGINTGTPAVRLAVNGAGTNVYNTDIWSENNIHVQGNETMTQGGRGRLRVGSAWGYQGLYTDPTSTSANNDLILGASSGTVRVGPGAASAQNLYIQNGFGWAINNSATIHAFMGFNSNANGSGVGGAGNNQTMNYLVAGSGGSFTGITNGVFAYNTSLGVSQAIYTNNGGVIGRVNHYNGTTQFKILGTGTVSTIVEGINNNEKVTLFCPESPEILFTDYGQGQLVNGKAHIELDPIFVKNVTINEKHPLRVFVQLEGNCKGVYITNKTNHSFDVMELDGGASNVTFQWNVVCNRADEILPNGKISRNADMRFSPVVPDEKIMQLKDSNLPK